MGCSQIKDAETNESYNLNNFARLSKELIKENDNKIPILDYSHINRNESLEKVKESDTQKCFNINKKNYQLKKWKSMIQTGLSSIKDKNVILNYCAQRRSSSNNFNLRQEIQQSIAESEIGLHYFYKMNPKLFFRRVRKGPPRIYRWLAWKTLLSFSVVFQKGLYSIYLTQIIPSEYDELIIKDVDRTFVNLTKSSEKENNVKMSLSNILKAYSLYNKSVGYCQGMNFIAAMLLVISEYEEEEAFWGLVSLLEYSFPQDPLKIQGLKGCYENFFPQLQVLNGLFKFLIFTHFSSIFLHLEKLEYFEIFFLIKWILSLFLYDFPFEFCIRIWDYLFVRGISFILIFAASLLYTKEKEIILSEQGTTYKIISQIKNDININNLNYLLKFAKNLPIDWKSLENEKVKLESNIRSNIVKEQLLLNIKNLTSNTLSDESSSLICGHHRSTKLLKVKKPQHQAPKLEIIEEEGINVKPKNIQESDNFDNIEQLSKREKLIDKYPEIKLNLNLSNNHNLLDGLNNSIIFHKRNSSTVRPEERIKINDQETPLVFPRFNINIIQEEKSISSNMSQPLTNSSENEITKRIKNNKLGMLKRSLKMKSKHFNHRIQSLESNNIFT